MKKQLLTSLFLVCLTSAFSQQTQEEKVVYKLQSRAYFKELDSLGQIVEDSIFEAASGFRVFSDYTTQEINGTLYRIIRYPDFSRGGFQRASNRGSALAPNPPVFLDLKGRNGKILCIPAAVFDTISKIPYYKLSMSLVGGQLTLPFKLRPKQADQNFQMTTDVTIGAYAGLRQRISRTQNYYLTVPVTLGLTFVNLNENSTSPSGTPDAQTGIVPGWTWSTGVIGQFNTINVGLVLGVDYASGVGDTWIYHKKLWYSFAVGFSFLQ